MFPCGTIENCSLQDPIHCFFMSCFQRGVVPLRGVPLFQQLTPKQWHFPNMCAPAVKTTPITFFTAEKPRLFLFFFFHVPGVGLNIICGSQTTRRRFPPLTTRCIAHRSTLNPGRRRRRWFAIVISRATSLNINFLRDVWALLHSSFYSLAVTVPNLFCGFPASFFGGKIKCFLT